MSAEVELISVDTIRSVRIPEAATTAPVHVATDLRESDVLVSVCASLTALVSRQRLINTISYFMTFKGLHLQFSGSCCFPLVVRNSVELGMF